MSEAFIISGCRTPVGVRNGAFADMAVSELGAIAIERALDIVGVSVDLVDELILGNALYGGGNPARVAALAANLPEHVGAMTIDTQCCSGLDAIALAAAKIRSGSADVIIAGGLESYSRSPIRQKRPLKPGEEAVSYERPPFTPWPNRDPDMLVSAAELASRLQVSRGRQEDYAVESHRRVREDATLMDEIVTVRGRVRDEFTRALTPNLCRRLKPLAGDDEFGVTAATTAVEADAAAVVVVVSGRFLKRYPVGGTQVLVRGDLSRGGDPTCPALAPVQAIQDLLKRLEIQPGDIDIAEIMEAFSVQALACVEGAELAPDRVNRRGGALAWGHPIGASGAILAVRLFHGMRTGRLGSLGLAAIAAAGGLGSAMVLETKGAK